MSLLLLLADGEAATTTARVTVNREYPPVKHSVIVRDPKTGAAIARWAEDEGRDHNVMSGLKLSGVVPGGKKELKATLPRNPRRDWPDTEGFLEIEAQLPGRKRIWHGRIGRAPRSDGERMVISGEAVGYAAALEDRGALRIGMIDSDLGKFGEPSTQRRIALRDAARLTQAQATTGFQDAGSASPALIFDYSGLVREKAQVFGNELWYHGGGVDLGALLFDWLGDSSTTWENYARLIASDLPAAGNYDDSANLSGVTSASRVEVAASVPGRKYAAFRSFYTGAFSGTMTNIMRAASVKVLSWLAAQNLTLQGEWPDVGYTAAQMLRLLVPLHSDLRVTEDSVEDDGFVISRAWWTDPPGTLARIVDELISYGLYDWFVKDAKLFEVREPGSYGTRWQAYQGPSNFQESGEDTERLWDRIVVGWPDADGRNRYVGWPGSGCEFEDERLQITDPDHPAVRTETVREDLLMLDYQASPSRAAEVGERWLAEANELPRSGSATFEGFLMDDRGVWRPAGEVAEGDLVRFPDGRDKSYRKVVDYDYTGDDLKSTVSVDAPSESLKALQERHRAVLQSLSG